jgi:glycerate-2-kinase
MKETARKIFITALDNATPEKWVDDWLASNQNFINQQKNNYSDSFIIAIGKAARPMAKALKKKLRIDDSNIICITPGEQAPEEYSIISSHPIPDQKSVNAAEKLIQFIEHIPDQSLVFFALSGGASALICKPAGNIALDDIKIINKKLIASGSSIHEINSVRKHLSAIKGGQLLTHFNENTSLVDLIISDVPGDDLEIIGSGLTVPDSSTFQDGFDALLKYKLWEKCRESIHSHIEKGLAGDVPETLKPGNDPVQNHRSYIIGSARKLAEKMAQIVEEKGYKPWIAEEPYNQPVEKVAEMVASKIKNLIEESNHPVALIFYGESTLKVTGNGKGGRNQELALRGALQIADMDDVTWLSAGTDGIDGPTDAAGAVVDGNTIKQAQEKGLNAREFLQNNDSYHFHDQMGALLKTGPTGNNVMDVVLVLVE